MTAGTGLRPRVLVADDEPDTLGLIELTLQTAGFEVETAANGTQAFERARNDRFDLLLLDVMMPDLTGHDVIRRLAAEGKGVPPVIFLSAKSRPEDRKAAEDLGAAAYLVKPTTRGMLVDTVRRVLAETASRHGGS